MAIRRVSVTVKNVWENQPPKQQGGGKNYIKNGNFLSGLDFWNTNNNPTTTTIYSSNDLLLGVSSALKIDFDSWGSGIWQNFTQGSNRLELNKPYTLSFLAKSDVLDTKIMVGHEQDVKFISLKSHWSRYIFRGFRPTEHKNFVFYSNQNTAGSFYITNIQLETGENASDFSDFPFVERAIQGTTDINGGLALSNVLGVKDKVGKIRAYMSGLEGTLTAFAAGVSNFGTPIEKRNIDIRHDGSANIGVFEVDAETGDVSILDKYIGGLKRLLFGQKKLPKLEQLLNSATETGTQNYSSISKTGTIKEVLLLGNPIELEQPKIDFTISANLEYLIPVSGHHSVVFGLYKYDENFTEYRPYNETVIVHHGMGGYGNQTVYTLTGSILDAPAGKYKLAVSLDIDTAISFDLSNIKLSYVADNTIRRIEFGNDGLMAFYSYNGKKNFIRITEDDGVQIGGKTDMPGILATGSYNGYGQDNQWGAKTGNQIVRTSQGVYHIFHNIGHGSFTASVNAHTENCVVTISSRNSQYIEIIITRNGNRRDSGFDYTLIGRNY